MILGHVLADKTALFDHFFNSLKHFQILAFANRIWMALSVAGHSYQAPKSCNFLQITYQRKDACSQAVWEIRLSALLELDPQKAKTARRRTR